MNSSKVPIGADYSPSFTGGNPLPLAHCYLGIQSHRGTEATREVIEARTRLGTSIAGDPVYGNKAIQSKARRAIASLLGSHADNVTLTGNTNEGLHIIKRGMGLTETDSVLIYEAEFVDVKTPFANRNDVTTGPKVVFFEGEKDGWNRPLGFHLEVLERALKMHCPRLLVVSHVQFPNGFTSDIDAIVKMARRVGTRVVVDVAQSFGVLPFTPEEYGCDAVVAPLWKWLGGLRGAGFLWTSEEFRKELSVDRLTSSCLPGASFTSDVSIEPLSSTGSRFEASTLPTDAVWVTTAEMLQERSEIGIPAIADRLRFLQGLILDQLQDSEQLLLCPNLNGLNGSFLSFALAGELFGKEDKLASIMFSQHQIDLTVRAGFLRIAPHAFNPEDSLIDATNKLREVIRNLAI